MTIEAGTQEYEDALHAEKDCVLSNGEQLALAHSLSELIEPLIERRTKLSFDEANGITSSYYTMRRLLKSVDKDLLFYHERLTRFYGLEDQRELCSDFDRLSWEWRKPETVSKSDHVTGPDANKREAVAAHAKVRMKNAACISEERAQEEQELVRNNDIAYGWWLSDYESMEKDYIKEASDIPF